MPGNQVDIGGRDRAPVASTFMEELKRTRFDFRDHLATRTGDLVAAALSDVPRLEAASGGAEQAAADLATLHVQGARVVDGPAVEARPQQKRRQKGQ